MSDPTQGDPTQGDPTQGDPTQGDPSNPSNPMSAQPGPVPPPGYAPPPPGYGPPPPGSVPPPLPTQYAGAEPPLSPSDERLWAMLAHLSIFVFSLLGPILILVILGKRSRFVDDQAKEALNFHISVLIASVISVLLCFVIIGFVLLPVVVIGSMVLGVIGALRANAGIAYRYPITLRLIS